MTSVRAQATTARQSAARPAFRVSSVRPSKQVCQALPSGADEVAINRRNALLASIASVAAANGAMPSFAFADEGEDPCLQLSMDPPQKNKPQNIWVHASQACVFGKYKYIYDVLQAITLFSYGLPQTVFARLKHQRVCGALFVRGQVLPSMPS